ncbi:MAG TPA: hypothetical protein VGD91_01395 [Trebonia sp.]
MALFVNAHPDVWMDGVAVAGNDLRLEQAGAFLTGASAAGSTGIAARPGVRYGTGSPLLVQASSGMNISVNAGVAWVQGTVSATAGMYTCCLDTTSTITVATSDPSNPRIDNVICQIVDTGSSSSTTRVTLQAGTPAPSPVAPTLPANSLLLATVAVGAGVSTINSGNITDARAYTAATGGIVPMANTTGGISGPAGTYADDLSTGRLRRSDGSGNARAVKTGAFAPALARSTSNFTINGTVSTLLTQSITVDGVTEVEVRAGYRNLSPISGPVVGDSLLFQVLMDGSVWPDSFGGWYFRQDSTAITGGGGTSLPFWGTPAAGTHTFTLTGVVSSGTGQYVAQVPFLRVEPASA